VHKFDNKNRLLKTTNKKFVKANR